MAKSQAERQRESRATGREAYRRELEAKRAKRLAGTISVRPFEPQRFADQMRLQAWASIHTIVYAAALTIALTALGHAYGAAGIGAIGALLCMGTLYTYLLRVWNLDLRELARPTMAVGIFLTYFVTWMATAFLVSNPPGFDDAAPEIRCCALLEVNSTGQWEQTAGQLEWHASENLWKFNGSRSTDHVVNATNGTAMLRFGAYDSGGVAQVTVDVLDAQSSPRPTVSMDDPNRGTFDYQLTNLTVGDYKVDINARDRAGHPSPPAFFLFTVRAP